MASTTPKLRACDRCASIKQVCDRDGKASCSRCTRKSLSLAVLSLVVVVVVVLICKGLELPCAIARVHKVRRPNCANIRSTCAVLYLFPSPPATLPRSRPFCRDRRSRRARQRSLNLLMQPCHY